MKRKLLLYAALLTLTQCSKCKNDPTPADPAAQLPPATQTGANTFGCLVNGQPYTPQGRIGLGSNFAVSYDPGFNGGELLIGTYRVMGTPQRQYLVVRGNHITQAGTYALGPVNPANAFFTDNAQPVPCNDFDSQAAGSFSKGTLTITRFDLNAGVIAGTFDFKFAKAGCDTLRLTQGRFDARI